MKKGMKRIFAAGLVLSMFAGCLAGCSSKESKEGASKDNNGKRFEGVTLRFAPVWGTDPEHELGRKMLDEFCEETGLTIELEDIAGDEMKNKIAVDVAANNAPDVWQYWPGCVCKDLADAGVLADVSEYMEKSEVINKEQFEDSAMIPCTFDGKLLALPRMGASAVLLINKEIFEKYNLKAPKTWDDLMAVSKVLRENGITPLNVGSKLGNPSHFFYNELVCQYQSGVEDVKNLMNTKETTFDTEAMVKAADMIEDMTEAGCFADDVLGSTGDWGPSTVYYDEGYSAMCYTLSWQFASLSDETIEKSEIIKIPQLSDTDREDNHIQGTTNDCYCISAKAWEDEEKQEAITALLDFLMWDFTTESAKKGYIITVNKDIDKTIDYDALDSKLMSEVLKWRSENQIESDPMIWQNLPNLAIQTDYCNALDELWAGTITGKQFIEKCENSVKENL